MNKAYAVVVLVAIGVGVFYLSEEGMLASLTDTGNGGTAIIAPIGSTATNQEDIQVYAGTLTMKNQLVDAEDPSTTLTDDTNADTVYYLSLIHI